MIRNRQETSSIVGHLDYGSVVMREATEDDRGALLQLASMDDQGSLRGRILVAESGERILAAISVDSGRTIADPWSHTDGLVHLLALRAEQLRASARTHAPVYDQRPSLVTLPARS